MAKKKSGRSGGTERKASKPARNPGSKPRELHSRDAPAPALAPESLASPETAEPTLSLKPDVVVVGIGASAGGLAALKQFFQRVPDDSGVAYVVVVHLSPVHESHLAALLQPHSRMEVHQVNKTMPLNSNCVYVIPPNANLSAIDTHLRLSALEESRRERAPIDHFFRTLAETHDGHAIGVILTGTGSDGTLGIKEIKLHGGLTVVQDPNEAEYDGMPQSAIATGMVDLILPVAAIPDAVLRYSQTEPRLPVTREGDMVESGHRVLLQKIFSQVRARTGRDFTRYKRATILRRIRRRMQLRFIDELDRYVEVLRQDRDEIMALADDLLITVTSFFRDPQVFKALQATVLPQLLANKGPDDEVRIWCVGCATGEEVYSLAMLLNEEVTAREGLAPKLYIFASDLHERSLKMARDGFYAGDVANDVSQERLTRYFVQEGGGYRIRKEVRERIVFAPHNLLSDPPFSRLDLVMCRNLLIYLQREVQSEVLRIFHYALKPGGYLVLGTSESIDDAAQFYAIDKGHSIFRRQNSALPDLRLPVFPILRRDRSNVAEADPAPQSLPAYELLHRDLLAQHAPPSVLIGPDGQIVHVSAAAGKYLQHPAGRLTAHATKLVRKELAYELTGALHAVRHDREPTRSRPVLVRFDGTEVPVVIEVRPALDAQFEHYCLVVFRELADVASGGKPAEGEDVRRYGELATELDATRQRLQGIIEEFETTQEEMKASNEELQSANEELRSTMEELETSKEELQSMNEELQTVNQENRHKVEELAMLSGDLQNLLSSTDIATLFLDRDLRILRFTPRVEELFNIRQTDRGRPIADLTNRIGYPKLSDDAASVLRQLTHMERELEDERGYWFLTRLLPYRGVDDRIEGVVVTFVDITGRKRAENKVHTLMADLEQNVATRTQQVRELTISLVRAEQRERRRLSETLHDELQQLLYGVQLKLRLAREDHAAGRGDAVSEQVASAEKLLKQATGVTRQLSVDLNPPILRSEGVRGILNWLRDQMRELHHLDLTVEAADEVRIEDADVRVMMFQAFRELLFNIVKHSGARAATVSLKKVNGELHVLFADEGKGFDADVALLAASTPGSIGLKSVAERIKLIGGQMDVSSVQGEGTQILLQLPLSARIGTQRRQN